MDRAPFSTSKAAAPHMNDATRTIVLPRATVVLRPERPEDDGFLFDLFHANNFDILLQIPLTDEMRAGLIAFQHRSQTATYRGLFPNACYSIVESQGRPIGRFIEHDEGETVYFVDFALMPEHHRRGIGIGLTQALMRQWAARGRSVRVKVLSTNIASLAMCRKLGFVEMPADDGAYIDLRWTPQPDLGA